MDANAFFCTVDGHHLEGFVDSFLHLLTGFNLVKNPQFNQKRNTMQVNFSRIASDEGRVIRRLENKGGEEWAVEKLQCFGTMT